MENECICSDPTLCPVMNSTYMQSLDKGSRDKHLQVPSSTPVDQ